MRPGFTLIELLVVITIIVVLLALLTPALDKAIYQAELAVCGTTLHGLINSVTVYTADFRRHYPVRSTVEGGKKVSPYGWLSQGNSFDDRKPLQGYLSINSSLNCPLTRKLDIAGSKVATYTYADYNLWFGWRYLGQRGMRKTGDRFEATEWTTGTVKSYNLLASDFSTVHMLGIASGSNHPDSIGAWGESDYQDEPAPWLAGAVNITWSFYLFETARGTLDLNYGSADGSVARHDAVKQFPADEERMDYIPNYYDPSSDAGREEQMPAS